MEPNPYPLATKSFFSSRLRLIAVGYHPVGMKPLGFTSGEVRSITAIALFDALATYSVLPSELTASAFGELPRGPFWLQLTGIALTTRLDAVSTIETVSLLALATKRRLPWGPRASALG